MLGASDQSKKFNGVNRTALTILTVIGVAAVLFYVSKDDAATPPVNQIAINQSSISGSALEPKTNEEGPVKVKVAPVDVSQNSKIWKFNIVLETHSVELDYDLTKVVSLFDDQGREYKPVSWEGPGPGGHHRDGILTFNTLNPLPKEIEIRISNVGGVGIRSFIWQIQ